MSSSPTTWPSPLVAHLTLADVGAGDRDPVLLVDVGAEAPHLQRVARSRGRGSPAGCPASAPSVGAVGVARSGWARPSWWGAGSAAVVAVVATARGERQHADEREGGERVAVRGHGRSTVRRQGRFRLDIRIDAPLRRMTWWKCVTPVISEEERCPRRATTPCHESGANEDLKAKMREALERKKQGGAKGHTATNPCARRPTAPRSPAAPRRRCTAARPAAGAPDARWSSAALTIGALAVRSRARARALTPRRTRCPRGRPW